MLRYRLRDPDRRELFGTKVGQVPAFEGDG
jgi:hypothetical protein